MKPPISGYYDQSEQLSPKPVLDTGRYDISGPAGQEDQIVVMFETPQEAQAAIDRLRAEGLAADAVVTDRTADGTNAGVNSEGGNTGLLGALKGLFAPDNEVHGFAEGVNRGHALLVIHPAIESRVRVVEILEASGPIDFDARLELWRTTGWQQLRAQEAATMGAASAEPAGAEAPSASVARPGVMRDPGRGSAGVRVYTANRG